MSPRATSNADTDRCDVLRVTSASSLTAARKPDESAPMTMAPSPPAVDTNVTVLVSASMLAVTPASDAVILARTEFTESSSATSMTTPFTLN